MSLRWNKKDIPHKGWFLVDVIDVRGNGESISETTYEKCMMCSNEKIRYVHIVSHPDFSGNLNVGCICAEKMTNDYITPKALEKKLRNKTQRRNNWLKKNWQISSKGNTYLKFKDNLITIIRDSKTNKYKCCVNNVWGKKLFTTIDAAKIATFNGLEYLKNKDSK